MKFKSLFEFNSCGTCPSPLRREIKEFKEFKEFKEINSEPDLISYEFNSPDLNSYEFNSFRIQFI